MYTLVEIEHEIFSTVILLLLIQEGMLLMLMLEGTCVIPIV